MSKQEENKENFELDLSEESFESAASLLEIVEDALEEVTSGEEEDEISLSDFLMFSALIYTRARAEARKEGLEEEKFEELLTACDKWWEEQQEGEEEAEDEGEAANDNGAEEPESE